MTDVIDRISQYILAAAAKPVHNHAFTDKENARIWAAFRALGNRYPTGDIPFKALGVTKTEAMLPQPPLDFVRSHTNERKKVDVVHVSYLYFQHDWHLGNLISVYEHWHEAPLPDLMFYSKDKYWVEEGHHRIGVQLIAGRKEIRATVAKFSKVRHDR